MGSNPSTRLVRPISKFNTSAGSVSDSGFLSAALNDMARAGAYIYPGASASNAEVPYAALASIMAQAQTASRNMGGAKFSAQLDDGLNGNLEFTGIETAPSLQLGTHNVGPLISAVHSTAIVHKLDFSLYTSGGAPDMRDVDVSNAVGALQQVMQGTVRHWIRNVLPDLTAAEQEEAVAIHEANTEPLRVVDRILSNSDELKIPGLVEVVEAVPMVKFHFLNMLLGGLNSSDGEFWRTFLGLLGELGLIYAPAFGGAEENGRLIVVETQLSEAASRTNIDGLQLRSQWSAPDSPVGKVMLPKVPMSGLPRGKDKNTTLPSQATRTSISYPPGAPKGRVVALPLPPFISPVFQSLAGLWQAQSKSMVPASIRASQDRAKSLALQQQNAVHDFLRGYAKTMYGRLQLSLSAAGIAVPMSFDWEVGKAYEVGVRGTKMFKGILASVTHNVSSKGNGSALTELAFSHVLWGGNSF